jgi:Bacterial toxin 23
MKKIIRCFFVIVFFSLSLIAAAQPNWKYEGYFNFGCNLNFTYNKSQQFPGLRLYVAFIANGIYKNNFTVNYGPSLSVYTKCLGANLNPLTGDIQVDFTNSFSVGTAWGKQLNYVKFFKTLNTASFYNIASGKKYGAYLSTNFILNNHRRNQIVGAVSLSAPDFTINYYNDGAAPFNILPLADNFDRWWTGGFGIYIHNHRNYNVAELSFDQFTGYSPLLYELSNIIGINLPDYNVEDSTAKNYRQQLTPAFNTSNYNLKIFLGPGYAIDAGVLGSLRSRSGRVFGLQEIIHTMFRYPLHPNNDINRFYIGGTYNNMNHVAL